MIFTLEALNAKYGDALLLHFGTTKNPRVVVIDGGPGGVYKNTLLPRLKSLSKKRGGGPLAIDLAMVSHIDSDHIRGLLDLAVELDRQDQSGIAPSFDVAGLWHNSFADLTGTGATPASLASVSSSVSGATRDITAAVASVPEGLKLRGLAKTLGWKVNPWFPTLVSLPKAGPKTVKYGSLELTVIGPSAERASALKAEWTKVLKARPTASRVLELTDKTVSNLSSIIVIAKVGKKEVLLTGDARADDIEAGLRAAHRLDGSPARFDVVKVAHHGSIRSASTSFYEHVLADNYVISADGTYKNPDTATLQLLVDARGSDKYTIHLTNKTGKNGLEKRLSTFFASDKKHNNRNYAVKFRAPSKLSMYLHLGSDAFEY